MKRAGIYFFFLVVFSVCCSMSGTAGCGLVKRLKKKPPPEGVVQESQSLRLTGFQETVTVKATPDELISTLSDPSPFMPKWVKMGKMTMGENGRPVLGSTVPFTISLFGPDIKGNLIAVKSEPDAIWYLWDALDSIQIQRWEFKKVDEGTRLTLKIITQLPTGGPFPDPDSLVDLLTKDMFEDLDMFLARVQAHFDPSLKPEELVAMGFRGDAYEAIMQLHQASVYIDATPTEVERWTIKAENIPVIMDEFVLEDKYLEEMEKADLEELVYVPTAIKYGPFKAKTDAFFVKKKKGKSYTTSVYLTAFGRVGLLQNEMDPEKGGTKLTLKVVFEIPSIGGGERMDALTFLAKVPQMVAQRAMVIKNGMEAGK